MAQNHEDAVVELHSTMAQRQGSQVQHDATGAKLPVIEHEKNASDGDISTEHTADDLEPTDHEKATLRHIGDAFPKSAYLVAVVELCERFTYYGCQGLFQNYINNHPDGRDGPRGLGLGHAGATGLNSRCMLDRCERIVGSCSIQRSFSSFATLLPLLVPL
jgi:POT family proton-dependent oligopeptide transporter